LVKLLIRLIVNAFAIWLAAQLIDGIELTGNLWQALLVALIFGFINAVIKPLLEFFSAPLIIVTLGIFTLVLNALLLLLTSWLTDALTVSGLWAAILGALVISIISWALGFLLGD
jgi:putative membrane protein